jgi:succinate dehydrogenase/fumarate reductase flavoprotein subunit
MSKAEFDVVVVGYGSAGAMAAIAANDAGARVLIVEKMEEGGGSTQEAGGSIRPPKDIDQAALHYQALSAGTTPLTVMQTIANGEYHLPDTLTSMGAKIQPFEVRDVPFPVQRHATAYPHIVGAAGLGERIRVAGESPEQRGGEALWGFLARHVADRGIEVVTGVRVVRLHRNVSGRVSALDVLRPSTVGTDAIRLGRGVVLACGGFGHDPALKLDYLGADIGAMSPPGRATGDGIRMAAAVGADLWHMNAVSCAFGYRFPGHEAAFYCEMPRHGYFLVDQTGHRYCDESSIEIHSALNALGVRNPLTGALERIPSYIIFDEETRRAGRIFKSTSGYNRHWDWSADNSVELENGWIKHGQTMPQLAEALGIPGSQLAKTADDFERGVDTGSDSFGRPSSHVASMSSGPFYGLPLWPCLLNTQGGPRRDQHARVLDPLGDPIEGLYSAGELGSAWGVLYPGSGNVAEALIFGEIAGRNAATNEVR